MRSVATICHSVYVSPFYLADRAYESSGRMERSKPLHTQFHVLILGQLSAIEIYVIVAPRCSHSPELDLQRRRLEFVSWQGLWSRLLLDEVGTLLCGRRTQPISLHPRNCSASIRSPGSDMDWNLLQRCPDYSARTSNCDLG
jgi:hypothetical protein